GSANNGLTIGTQNAVTLGSTTNALSSKGFTVDKDGNLDIGTGRFKVNVADGKTTIGANTANQTILDNGKSKSTITEGTKRNVTTSDATANEVVFTDTAGSKTTKVKTDANGWQVGNASINYLAVDSGTGVTTFGNDATNNVSKIDGKKMTLGKDVTDQTVLDAGNATFTSSTSQTMINGNGLSIAGSAGNSFDFKSATGIGTFTSASGKTKGTTTIQGNTITTETLNVNTINLGNGTSTSAGNDGNVTIKDDGSASFAKGKFQVAKEGYLTNEFVEAGSTVRFTTGASGTSSSYNNGTQTATSSVGNNAITNKVMNNTTGTNGTSSTLTETGATTTVKDGTATNTTTDTTTSSKNEVTNGNNSSSVENTTTGTTNTVTDGTTTNTVTTGTNGTTFTNTGNNTAFVTGGATDTTINGNTITTGKITADQLVITGGSSTGGTSGGNADGSLTLSGDGSFNSSVQDDKGKQTSFTSDINGVNSTVTDGTTTGSNIVTGSQVSSGVANNDGSGGSSTVTNATGITSTVTDGTTTNTVTTTKDGVTVGDGKATTTTTISKDDVQLGTGEKLSYVGTVDELTEELKNKEKPEETTLTDALNNAMEITHGEISRLDGRIDEVSGRLDKVGAMAAAAASLKTMGYDPEAPTEVAVGVGTYKGSKALALGLFHYPNRDFMLNVNYSMSGSENMGGVGATWKFGRKNPQKIAAEKARKAQEQKVQAQKLASDKAAKLMRDQKVQAAKARLALAAQSSTTAMNDIK
ncbi:MAG: YadA C-terminal domain-containing protein, partial [Acidaminococcaceae bacterium]